MLTETRSKWLETSLKVDTDSLIISLRVWWFNQLQIHLTIPGSQVYILLKPTSLVTPSAKEMSLVWHNWFWVSSCCFMKISLAGWILNPHCFSWWCLCISWALQWHDKSPIITPRTLTGQSSQLPNLTQNKKYLHAKDQPEGRLQHLSLVLWHSVLIPFLFRDVFFFLPHINPVTLWDPLTSQGSLLWYLISLSHSCPPWNAPSPKWTFPEPLPSILLS